MSGFTRSGGNIIALAGVRPEAAVRCARTARGGRPAPAFDGDMAAFVAAHPLAASQCQNRVKVCGSCGKVCAVSIAACNACGAPMAGVEESRRPNVFTGFIFGVARGPFPFKTSTRLESEDVLVFDDPLAMAGCHVCAIPTDVYVATATGLFVDPRRGARLARRLEAAAREAAEAQFLADGRWRAKTYGEPAPGDLTRAAIAGFNVPPSQFQLHLQYMLPPLFPHQAQLYRAGAHFTKNRFFPLAYVLEALDALAARGLAFEDAESLDGPGLAARVREAVGLDYDAAWARCYEAVAADQERLGRWDPADFAYRVADGSRAVAAADGGAPSDAPDADALAKADRLALQSYDAAGGVYYDHPKPAPLPTLAEAAFLDASSS